jgi:hypothetical protein
MTLDDLVPAIATISNQPANVTAQGRAYLLSYPHLVELAQEGTAGPGHFVRVSAMAYGWMQRVFQFDAGFFDGALATYTDVLVAEHWDNVDLQPIKCCLHSMVGASKVAHLSRPGVFPIWDSNVERFSLDIQSGPRHHHMIAIENYQRYAREVSDIIENEPNFEQFHADLAAAMNARFHALHIQPYEFSAQRAVDLAAFELA